MKKQALFLLLFSWLGCFNHSDNPAQIFQEVQQLNQRMEALYDAGSPEKLAAFYTEDAVVFGPNDELRGRAAIKEYWERINSPVSLSLEILDLQTELDSLNFIQKNINAKEQIPSTFIDQLDKDTHYAFQLTKTTLTYEREDVTFFKGETISLMNWEKQPEGHYRIKSVWLMQ